MQHLISIQTMLFDIWENKLFDVLFNGLHSADAVQNSVTNRVHVL